MMKDKISLHRETGSAQALELQEYDLTVASTMLQLQDYPLLDPDENVGFDPYNSA